MRQLIYSMLTTLDLYVEGPDGEFGWAEPDAELHKRFNANAATMTTHLYGRRMWQMLSVYWPTGESDPAGTPETRAFARYWNAGEHIVFSRTLQTVDHGACLVHDNVVDVVRQLTSGEGSAMDVGGAGLASTLIEAGLVDEIHAYLNPVAVGGGKAFLFGLKGRLDLRLLIPRAGRFVPFTTPSTGGRAHASAFAAHFVEVHVDPDLGTIRVARVVSAVDGGRILNPKTAGSQIIGGIAGGIGMALLEDTVSDRTGRVVTTSLADYVVAANANVRDVDVLLVGQPDSMTPLGTKGVGELSIVGMAAAIANAVYHATGARVRSLPISIEKVLGHESSSPRVSSPLAAIAAKARGASDGAV